LQVTLISCIPHCKFQKNLSSMCHSDWHIKIFFLERPPNRTLYSQNKIIEFFPSGELYISSESSTLGKGYEMMCDAIGKIVMTALTTWGTCWGTHWRHQTPRIPLHIGNTVRTHWKLEWRYWELHDNTLRTSKLRKFFAPQKTRRFEFYS
jgi:hypothetical protein